MRRGRSTPPQIVVAVFAFEEGGPPRGGLGTNGGDPGWARGRFAGELPNELGWGRGAERREACLAVSLKDGEEAGNSCSIELPDPIL